MTFHSNIKTNKLGYVKNYIDKNFGIDYEVEGEDDNWCTITMFDMTSKEAGELDKYLTKNDYYGYYSKSKEVALKQFEDGTYFLNAGNGKPPMKNFDYMEIEYVKANEYIASFYLNDAQIYQDLLLIRN